MGWEILYYTLEVFKWLIIARAVMSWFVGPHTRNAVADLLRRATDPILRPISDLLPIAGGFDFSPIVAFFAITIVQQLIFRIG